MRFTISGKNIEVTDGLRSAVTDKLGKLERYFTPETEIIVTMSVEKEKAEDRGDDPGERQHHPFRTGQQRYVCIHRPSGGSHRASASQI